MTEPVAARAGAMLEGVRVIELGQVLTAPYCGMLLADLGADVIKVERPEGDPFRAWHGGDQYGPPFIAFNRNKRSIVLDLALAADRETLDRLIAGADVLLDNFRPGALERLGLSPARLSRLNPRLIQCSITGFGDKGPNRHRPAFDGVMQAYAGVTSLFVDPARPEAVGTTISDNVTGMYACYAILGALFERTRTGHGRRLEVNMLEATLGFMPDMAAVYTREGRVPDRHSRSAASNFFILPCADGKLVSIHLSNRQKFWQGLTAALEDPALQDDGRFATYASRSRHREALQQVIGERLLRRTRAEWVDRLYANDVPCAPVNSIAEVLDDPQIAALGTLYKVRHPKRGDVAGIQPPVLVDGRRPGTGIRPPPELGEHTAEILAELNRNEQA